MPAEEGEYEDNAATDLFLFLRESIIINCMTREKKLALINKIYWDYVVSPEEILDKIEGKSEWTDERERNRTFVRTFETLRWNETVAIWSLKESMACLDNEDIEKNIRRQQSARFHYLRDFLHGKTVSPPEQNFECYKRIVPLLVSNRWYGVK